MDPKTVRLVAGMSPAPSQGACLEQLVSLLAGEPFTDRPWCACPVIIRFGIATNDTATDDQRQLLYPFAVRQIGTRDDGQMVERALMCADWAVREAAPISLDATGHHKEARRLRNLDPVVDRESASAAASAAALAPALTASSRRMARAVYHAAATARAAAAAHCAAAVHAAWDAAAAYSDSAAAHSDYAARAAPWEMRLELLNRLCPPWPTVDEIENLNWGACETVPGLEHAREACLT